MQMSCLKDKPNMSAGVKGDTPEVVGRQLSIIRIYTQETSITRFRVLDLTRTQPRGLPHFGVPGRCAWPKT